LVGHDCGVPGCTEVSACNYNSNATVNDGSCISANTWYLDADSDGYYVSQTTACSSPGVGYFTTIGILGDCDDFNSGVNAAVTEVCNGIDDNCNSAIDEGLFSSNTTVVSACDYYSWGVNGLTYSISGAYSVTSGCHTEILLLTINTSSVYYEDIDSDGYGSTVAVNFCNVPSSGYSLITGDCNDNQSAVNPNSLENCFNSVDDN
jgi:hypothetical protein